MELSVTPAGSFKTSYDARVEPEVAMELDEIATTVRRATKPFCVIGLLLTGSLARGEGTVLVDRNGGLRWLSDIECLVVAKKTNRKELARLENVIRSVEQERNNLQKSLKQRIKLELRLITEDRFACLRPSIFNYELLHNGKFLWGEPERLALPRWFRKGMDLPARDALRLLNNRIMEQVELRMSNLYGVDRELFNYAISKFWLDLGTSLSVFLGCYQPTYQSRLVSLDDFLTNPSSRFDRELVKEIREKMWCALAFKLGQQNEDFEWGKNVIDDVARWAFWAWQWESSRLLGGAYFEPEPSQIVRRLSRIESLVQRLRSWGRIMLRSNTRRMIRPQDLWGAIKVGSLTTAVYAAGCILEFYWNDIETKSVRGMEAARITARLLGLDTDFKANSCYALAERALRLWHNFVRFAAD